MLINFEQMAEAVAKGKMACHEVTSQPQKDQMLQKST